MSSNKSQEQRNTNSFEGRLITAFGGIPLAEIAKNLEENPKTFWNWAKERTEMPHKVLAKIAKQTNFSLNWLLTGEGEPLVDLIPKEREMLLDDNKNKELVLENALFSLKEVNDYYDDNNEEGIEALEVIYHQVLSLVGRRKLKLKETNSPQEE